MDNNEENITQKDHEDASEPLTAGVSSEVVTGNIPPESSNKENINQEDQEDTPLTSSGPEVVADNSPPISSNDNYSSTIFVTKELDSKMQLSSTSILSSPPSSGRTVMAPTESRRNIMSQIQMDESIQKSSNSMIDGPNQQRISSLDLLGKVDSSMRNLNATASNHGDSQFTSSSTLQQYSNGSSSTAADNNKTSRAAVIVENDEDDVEEGEVEHILPTNVQPDFFHAEIPHAYLVTDATKKNSFIDLWNSCWNRIIPSSSDRINNLKLNCSKQQLMIFCGILILICVLLGSILGTSSGDSPPMTGSDSDSSENVGSINGRWDLIQELKTDSVNAKFGASVAMHANENKVLVGEPGNSAFKLFTFSGKGKQAYSSKGKFIDSGTMGESVAMSENGHVLAGGGRYYDNSGRGTVYVAEIFDNYNRGEITRVDWKIGYAEDDHFGSSIALSSDGEYLSVGADQETCPTCSGYVITYKWAGDKKKYEQRGAILRGKNPGDMFGNTISMTTDGNTLAIGSSHGNYVRVYKWRHNKWEQKGTDITPPNTSTITENDQFGFDIALSSNDDDDNSMTLVISNPHLKNSYIYQFESTNNEWIDSGMVLKNGGNFVAINDDGTFVVIADSTSILFLEKVTALDRWFRRGTLPMTNTIQSVSLSQHGNTLLLTI